MTIDINLFSLFGKKKKNNDRNLLDEYGHGEQKKPTGYYVYGHFNNDEPFYIGKGNKRRAWSDKRNNYWKYYVDNHLNGIYKIIILKDGMTEGDAEYLEDKIMKKNGGKLLNIIDFGRVTNLEELDKYHSLRNKTLAIYKQGLSYEKTDINMAADTYIKAIQGIDKYAFLSCEGGFLGKIMDEMKKCYGYSGELHILNRLSICLKKLNKNELSKEIAIEYFKKFRNDTNKTQLFAIKKRTGLITENDRKAQDARKAKVIEKNQKTKRITNKKNMRLAEVDPRAEQIIKERKEELFTQQLEADLIKNEKIKLLEKEYNLLDQKTDLSDEEYDRYNEVQDELMELDEF